MSEREKSELQELALNHMEAAKELLTLPDRLLPGQDDPARLLRQLDFALEQLMTARFCLAAQVVIQEIEEERKKGQ